VMAMIEATLELMPVVAAGEEEQIQNPTEISD